MNDICLDNATIHYEGNWLSADELARKIQDKMQSGDLKIATLAAALERLNTAVENTHTIDGVRLVLSKEEYKKLIARGGSNERECLKKAIMAFIGNGGNIESFGTAAKLYKGNDTEKKAEVKCIKCKSPIDTHDKKYRTMGQCPDCIAKAQLYSLTNEKPRYRDHYIG